MSPSISITVSKRTTGVLVLFKFHKDLLQEQDNSVSNFAPKNVHKLLYHLLPHYIGISHVMVKEVAPLLDSNPPCNL